MQSLFAIDWHEMFVPSKSLVEIFIRGTLTYLFLFVVLRFFLTRQSGAIGISDLLVIVIIADAVQNAMSAEYKSMTEGAVLVLTIVFWDYAFDWLSFRFPAFARFARSQPLLLMKEGRRLRRNMAREKITEDELLSQLRHHGVDDEADVKEAYLEADGRMSVVKRDKGDAGAEDSGSEKQF